MMSFLPGNVIDVIDAMLFDYRDGQCGGGSSYRTMQSVSQLQSIEGE